MLKRDADDPRLPAWTGGEWSVESDGLAFSVVGPPKAPGYFGALISEADAKACAISKEAICHLFGLMTNFPKLGKERKWEGSQIEECLAADALAWLDEQAPYICETLKKAGVDLEAK